MRDVQYLLTSIRPIHEVLESLGKILYIKYCFVQIIACATLIEKDKISLTSFYRKKITFHLVKIYFNELDTFTEYFFFL